MENFLLELVGRLLDWLGLNTSEDVAKMLAAMVIVALVATLLGVIVYVIMFFVTHRFTSLSESHYGRFVLERRNLKRVAFAVAVVVFYVLLPLTYYDGNAKTVALLGKMLDCLVVIAFLMLVITFFRVLYNILSHRENLKNRPLKGAFQVVQILTYIVGAILIISILMGKSPAKLLTGLGAFAAVLSLVFKNTILGLVSGVLFSYEDMMSIGDWISMPRYEINGIVEEITLNTVKVRNFDNTVTTVPPYILTTEAFKNWTWMLRSGGRRIMRSVNVDMNSVNFCSEELLDRLTKVEFMAESVRLVREKNSAERAESLVDGPVDVGAGIVGRPTNLGLFRIYLLNYMESMPQLNRDMLYMVRELEPTELGLPLQIYMFSSVTAWAEYEKIQTALFEHVIAMMPMFELRPYQRISDSVSAHLDEME